MSDVLVEWMKKHDIEVTRENYLMFAWGNDLPDPWTPEHEAELPEELQEHADSNKEGADDAGRLVSPE